MGSLPSQALDAGLDVKRLALLATWLRIVNSADEACGANAGAGAAIA